MTENLPSTEVSADFSLAPMPLPSEWQGAGRDMTAYSGHADAVRVVNDMLLPLSEEDRAEVNRTFPRLTEKSVSVMLGVLTDRRPVTPVQFDWTEMDALREIPAYRPLIEEWGGMAHQNIGKAITRMWAILDRLPQHEAKSLIRWFDRIPIEAATSIVRRLAA